jgi:hypothetical protein
LFITRALPEHLIGPVGLSLSHPIELISHPLSFACPFSMAPLARKVKALVPVCPLSQPPGRVVRMTY